MKLRPLNDFLALLADASDRSPLRNCCGQYALASVLDAYGSPVAFLELVERTNPAGIYTDSRTLLAQLASYEIPAVAYNNSSVEALRRHLDRGLLALMLVGAGVPHWVVVATDKDPSGETRWRISDAANLSGTKTFVGDIAEDQLLEAWARPFGVLSSLTPYRNYWIAIGESAAPAPSRATNAADALAHTMRPMIEGIVRAARRLIPASRD